MAETAIILPSRNEADSIAQVARLVDVGLVELGLENDAILINADNSDASETAAAFNEAPTTTSKLHLDVSDGLGKGDNVMIGVEAALSMGAERICMFDTDLLSFEPRWVGAYLQQLKQGADFVAPRYSRYWIEGGTTNHLCYPVVQALSGRSVSQPIAGDFGFSKKLASRIYGHPITEDQRAYGIDIMISGTATFEQMNIAEVKLDRKIHKPSFDKTTATFLGAASSLFNMIGLYRPKLPYELSTPEVQPMMDSEAPDAQRLVERRSHARMLLGEFGGRIAVQKAMTEERWVNVLKDHVRRAYAGENCREIARSLLPYFLIRTADFLSDQKSGHEAGVELARLPKMLHTNLPADLAAGGF